MIWGRIVGNYGTCKDLLEIIGIWGRIGNYWNMQGLVGNYWNMGAELVALGTWRAHGEEEVFCDKIAMCSMGDSNPGTASDVAKHVGVLIPGFSDASHNTHTQALIPGFHQDLHEPLVCERHRLARLK
ncbi:hypothetical protein VNO77_44277 [Canavalia gladiata]|uniref:Uncharacterized protein n=1 Tax=Canavalia gladiata TaxID=3824 RepID=A0AAN9JXW9_CANGL